MPLVFALAAGPRLLLGPDEGGPVAWSVLKGEREVADELTGRRWLALSEPVARPALWF